LESKRERPIVGKVKFDEPIKEKIMQGVFDKKLANGPTGDAT